MKKIEKKIIDGEIYELWDFHYDTSEDSLAIFPTNLYYKIQDSNAFKLFTYLTTICNYKSECIISIDLIKTILKLDYKEILNVIKYLEDLSMLKITKEEDVYIYCNLYRLIECNNLQDKYIFTDIDIFGDEDEEEIVTTVVIPDKNLKSSNRKDNGYSSWKKNVLKRDDYTCQLCGRTNEETILNVHHIERYADNEKLRTDINNGITLCCDCHKKVFNKEKEYEEYFKKLIKNSK